MTSTRVALYAVGWASLAALWAVSHLLTNLGPWATPGPPFGILQPNGYTDDIPGYVLRTVLIAAVVGAIGVATMNVGAGSGDHRARSAVVVTLSYLSMALVSVTAFAPVWALLAPGSWEPSDLSIPELRADAVSSVPTVLSAAVIPFAAFGLAVVATALRWRLAARALAASRAAALLATVHLALVLEAGASAVESTYSLANLDENAAESLALGGLAVVAAYLALETGAFLVKRWHRRGIAEPAPASVEPRISS